jgi:hypothetical protein
VVVLLVINLVALVLVAKFYHYLYGGKVKPQKPDSDKNKQIFLGILDAIKEQHERDRK